MRAVEGLGERAATGGVADDAAGGASDGASRPAASPGEGSAAAHPAHGMAVSVLVVAALLVLTQLYAAIPLLGPVSATMGGDTTGIDAGADLREELIGQLRHGPSVMIPGVRSGRLGDGRLGDGGRPILPGGVGVCVMTTDRKSVV